MAEKKADRKLTTTYVFKGQFYGPGDEDNLPEDFPDDPDHLEKPRRGVRGLAEVRSPRLATQHQHAMDEVRAGTSGSGIALEEVPSMGISVAGAGGAEPSEDAEEAGERTAQSFAAAGEARLANLKGEGEIPAGTPAHRMPLAKISDEDGEESKSGGGGGAKSGGEGGGGKQYSASELEDMSVEKLERLAKKRGVMPEEGSGADGKVLKKDLVDALKAD